MSTLSDLATEPRWLSWHGEVRGDKVTKVPYVTPKRKASSTDPLTWRDRARAEACATLIINGHGGGVGIVLGDVGADLHLCGLDLNSCLRDGVVAPWAAVILRIVNTYTEISPSGSGLKCFFYIATEHVRPLLDRIGVDPKGWGCRRDVPGEDARNHGPAVEFYTASCYFAVTDNRWPDAPDIIRTLDADDLEQLAGLIPSVEAAGKSTGKSSRDNSNSAVAFRKGARMRRGGKTFEQMVKALFADPETSDWASEKGQAEGEPRVQANMGKN